MKWSELSIHTPPEYVEPLSELFRRYGEGGVVIEELGDWDPDSDHVPSGPPDIAIVRTYLRQDATYRSRCSIIQVGVRLIALLAPLGELQESILEEGEWLTTWRSHYALLRIGRRLVIRPSWQEYTPRPGEAVLVQDPGMAFGTGHHPTTRRCLEQLERRVAPEMSVLDLGTGSGILAIAAVKLGAGEAAALDDDATAVESARANAQANGVDRELQIIHGTLPHPLISPGGYQLVVANLTAQVIVSKAEPLMDALAPDGLLVVSGILRERLPEVEEALTGVDMVVAERIFDDDWVTLAVEHSPA